MLLIVSLLIIEKEILEACTQIGTSFLQGKSKMSKQKRYHFWIIVCGLACINVCDFCLKSKIVMYCYKAISCKCDVFSYCCLALEGCILKKTETNIMWDSKIEMGDVLVLFVFLLHCDSKTNIHYIPYCSQQTGMIESTLKTLMLSNQRYVPSFTQIFSR